jgi:hypothetical protein
MLACTSKRIDIDVAFDRLLVVKDCRVGGGILADNLELQLGPVPDLVVAKGGHDNTPDLS